MKRKDIFPSKFLAASDLEIEGKPDEWHEWSVTITKQGKEPVGREKELRLVLHFDGIEKGMVVNVTNFNTIEKLHGEDTNDWVSKRIRLFINPDVTFGSDSGPAIRVRSKVPEQRSPGEEG